MGTEISVIGEYALYTLYILLIISIGVFIYILQKKQLPLDIKDKEKTNLYDVDQNLIKPYKKHIVKNDIKTLEEQKHQEFTDMPNKPKVTPSAKPDNKESHCLDIYLQDMPGIEDVKPYFFEYFKGKKLLVVEDNKINQKILLNVLKNINTPIDVADNGQEAIEKVLNEKKSYDMILMDISMPVMDGINATKHIRNDSGCDNIPIVTVTAFTSGLEIGQMFEAGANAFLTKPLDIHKLFTVMLLFLDNKQSDLDINKEFDILGINLEEVKDKIHADQNEIKEAIEEFINKLDYLEDKIPLWIDNHDFIEVQRALDELGMILDLIGAKKMQNFIEDMKNAMNRSEGIEEYKILFKAQFKALLNTYQKYLNSI